MLPQDCFLRGRGEMGMRWEWGWSGDEMGMRWGLEGGDVGERGMKWGEMGEVRLRWIIIVCWLLLLMTVQISPPWLAVFLRWQPIGISRSGRLCQGAERVTDGSRLPTESGGWGWVEGGGRNGALNLLASELRSVITHPGRLHRGGKAAWHFLAALFCWSVQGDKMETDFFSLFYSVEHWALLLIGPMFSVLKETV